LVLEYGGKIQAIANVELQSDGIMWVRGLNSAPWNQGPNRKFSNSGLSVMARIVSFALERDQKTIRLAAKDDVANFYKKLGMNVVGQKYFDGEPHTIFAFDVHDMKEFLNRFQINLSF